MKRLLSYIPSFLLIFMIIFSGCAGKPIKKTLIEKTVKPIPTKIKSLDMPEEITDILFNDSCINSTSALRGYSIDYSTATYSLNDCISKGHFEQVADLLTKIDPDEWDKNNNLRYLWLKVLAIDYFPLRKRLAVTAEEYSESALSKLISKLAKKDDIDTRETLLEFLRQDPDDKIMSSYYWNYEMNFGSPFIAVAALSAKAERDKSLSELKNYFNAQNFWMKGKAMEAYSILSSSTFENPVISSAAKYSQGVILLRSGNSQKALGLLYEAFSKDPMQITRWHSLAWALVEEGKYKEAEAVLKTLSLRLPKHSLTWYFLGKIQFQYIRNAEEALKSIECAIGDNMVPKLARNHPAHILLAQIEVSIEALKANN